MKRTVILSFLFLMLFSTFLFSAEKMLLGEVFTNTSCGYCLAENEYFDDIYGDVDDGLVLIRYHVSWPSPADPFHVYNPSENTARKDFYSITGVPFFALDGVGGSSSSTITPSYVTSHTSAEAPCEISLVAIGVDSVRVTVEADSPDFIGDFKVFVVLTEDSLYFVAPNGQRNFHQTMRDMISGPHGVTVSISPEEPFTHSFPLVITDDLDLEHCHIVAFVQLPGSGGAVVNANVIQLYGRPDYSYTVASSSPSRVITSAEENVNVDFSISNTGSMSDSYNISVISDTPAGWVVELYHEALGTFVDSDMNLPGVTSQDFELRVNPNSVSGSSEISVVVSSDELGTADTLSFNIVTPQDVLLVNASGSEVHGSFYTDILDELGVAYTYWDQANDGTISSFESTGYQVVIWFSGENDADPIPGASRNSLLDFLEDHEGKVLITGNHLANHLQTDFPFLYQTLGAMYIGPKDSVIAVQALYGNPVFHDAYLPFDYMTCEQVGRYSDAEIFLIFPDMQPAALINELDDGGRSCYLAFAPELTSVPGSAKHLISHILDWLYTGDMVDEKISVPNKIATVNASPIPFNSTMNIDVEIAENIDYSINVVDLNGKTVDVLYSGNDNNILLKWQPSENVTSGVYSIVVTNGEKVLEKVNTVYVK